jgi:hypothetical protein
MTVCFEGRAFSPFRFAATGATARHQKQDKRRTGLAAIQFRFNRFGGYTHFLYSR